MKEIDTYLNFSKVQKKSDDDFLGGDKDEWLSKTKEFDKIDCFNYNNSGYFYYNSQFFT